MNDAEHRAEEVQELVWALIDDYATERQMRRLEELLLDDAEARRVYVTCMQMHADLHYLLGDKRPALPEVVRRAIEAERKQGTAPAADIPMSALNVQIPDAFA
ncbi:MAG: hypothetical protein JW959_07490 [Pirellulales bacterium]|nr:hypothetical protein [Pirellulales bacterium]